MLKYDKLILALILASAIGLGGFFMIRGGGSAAGAELTAVVQSPEGELRLDAAELYAAGEERTWRLKGSAGPVLVAFSPERGFAIIESGCPDQICVRSGFIDQAGQSAVCVPNQVLIRLEAGQSGGLGEEGLDGVLR